ncbi:hypothetical protein [Microbacterium rhizophilus]|uniref:hypothetical protein n=1 Tax=Microbacterium rhizophilus TaxID=3138934 RepID=UPI0031E90D60
MSDAQQWWKRPFSRDWWTRRRAIVAITTVAALVVVGGTAAAVVANLGARPTPQATRTQTPSPTPTPTPTPTPQPGAGELPRTATARADVAGWNLAGSTEVGAVLPQVGGASDGAVSLSFDAPAVQEQVVAAYTPIALTPGEEYDVSFDVRLLDEEVAETPVEIAIGDTKLEMPDLGSEWWTIEDTFTSGADQTAADLKVSLNGPVRGFAIDRIVIAGPDGKNVVPNASFEDVSSDFGIRNDALILNEKTATLAAAMAPGDATWVATRADGSEAARGAAKLGDRVSPVPLENLPQGYYDIAVTDSAGQTVSTPVGIVRMPEAYLAPDDRIGAHTHPTKAFNVDVAAAASSLGMGAIRFNITWKNVEKQRGVYAFHERYTTTAAQAGARGLGVLGIAGWTNPLYDGNRVPSSPDGLDGYGRYAAAIAQNFDLMGLEVFNEFNIPTFNKGCRSGGCYLPLLQSAHQHVDAVAPDLPVIGGVTGNYEGGFFDELWARGGLNSADAMSFHPYQVYGSPDGLAGVAKQARDSMRANGGEKPIWVTELGWTTKTGDVSLTEQGNRLVRAQSTALASGISHYFWYDLVNDTTNQADHEGNFGLFWQPRGGVAALPPKPAAFVQALWLATLDNREFAGVDRIDGVRSVSFGEPGDTSKVAYPTAGPLKAEFPAWDTVTVTDLAGAVTEVEPRAGRISIDLDRIVLLGGGIGEAPAGEQTEPGESSPEQSPEPQESPRG